MTVKALLLTREQYEEGNGLGLITLRKFQDQLIDFVSIGDFFYDNVTSYIVKDDVCYKTHKIFFDMDNNVAVQMCVEDINMENRYKEVNEQTEEVGGDPMEEEDEEI